MVMPRCNRGISLCNSERRFVIWRRKHRDCSRRCLSVMYEDVFRYRQMSFRDAPKKKKDEVTEIALFYLNGEKSGDSGIAVVTAILYCKRLKRNTQRIMVKAVKLNTKVQ